MLVIVTTRCDMGCSHCLASCVPEGEDITFANFRKAVGEIKKVDTVVILTGGEPLLHPEIWKMTDYALENGMSVVLTTNGYYLGKHEQECLKRLKEAKHRFLVQVTNDPRYYPKRIPDINVIRRLEKYGLEFVDKIQTLSELGRARENGMKGHGRNFPMCANSILVASQVPDLRTEIAELNSAGKMCHFSVMPNLDLMLSECRQIKLGSLLEPHWEKSVFDRLQIENQTGNENIFCQRCGLSNVRVLGIGGLFSFVKKIGEKNESNVIPAHGWQD